MQQWGQAPDSHFCQTIIAFAAVCYPFTLVMTSSLGPPPLLLFHDQLQGLRHPLTGGCVEVLQKLKLRIKAGTLKLFISVVLQHPHNLPLKHVILQAGTAYFHQCSGAARTIPPKPTMLATYTQNPFQSSKVRMAVATKADEPVIIS